MWNKLLKIIEKIKCKILCCYKSSCSLNENKIDDNNIDEVTTNYEEFKPK